jgi:hypothetical protein
VVEGAWGTDTVDPMADRFWWMSMTGGVSTPVFWARPAAGRTSTTSAATHDRSLRE